MKVKIHYPMKMMAIILAYTYLVFFYAYLNTTKFRFVHRLFNLLFYYESFFMLLKLHEA